MTSEPTAPRRLQRMGAVTVGVSLPREWVGRRGLAAGHPVFVRSLPDGSLHPVGYIPASIVDPSGVNVYPVGDRYVVVNLSGRAPVPPAAAVG